MENHNKAKRGLAQQPASHSSHSRCTLNMMVDVMKFQWPMGVFLQKPLGGGLFSTIRQHNTDGRLTNRLWVTEHLQHLYIHLLRFPSSPPPSIIPHFPTTSNSSNHHEAYKKGSSRSIQRKTH